MVSCAVDRLMDLFRQEQSETVTNLHTWWLIPLSKWFIIPVINGISRVNPLITGVITHLLSGMNHQVWFAPKCLSSRSPAFADAGDENLGREIRRLSMKSRSLRYLSHKIHGAGIYANTNGVY